MFGKKNPGPDDGGKSLAKQLTDANEQLKVQAEQLDALTGRAETGEDLLAHAKACLAQAETDLAARDQEVTEAKAQIEKLTTAADLARDERDQARTELAEAKKQLASPAYQAALAGGQPLPETPAEATEGDSADLNGILADFAALADPKERADFFAKNELAITKAVRDRKRAGK